MASPGSGTYSYHSVHSSASNDSVGTRQSVPPNGNELTQCVLTLTEQIQKAREGLQLTKQEYLAEISLQQELQRDLDEAEQELRRIEDEISQMPAEPQLNPDLQAQTKKLENFVRQQQQAIQNNEQKLAKLVKENQELENENPVSEEHSDEAVCSETHAFDATNGCTELQKMLNCLETQISMQKVILAQLDEQ